jgi:hypothetical protein
MAASANICFYVFDGKEAIELETGYVTGELGKNVAWWEKRKCTAWWEKTHRMVGKQEVRTAATLVLVGVRLQYLFGSGTTVSTLGYHSGHIRSCWRSCNHRSVIISCSHVLVACIRHFISL